jgi:hypothetical protein
MDYIICEKPGVFQLKNGDNPVRKKGEVLLKIKRVGICGTDLHAYGGNQAFFTYPRILGHELAAEVITSDENSSFKKDDKVVIMPYLSCGKCIACRRGKTNCCQKINVFGVHIDGGMQQEVVLPENVLLPAPGLSLDEITIVEPLAIGAHAIRRASIVEGDTVVVMGCGPIGIGIMSFALIRKAKVIAIDINKERLQYVKESIGVDAVVKAGNMAKEEIFELTNGDLALHVFDATGNKTALEQGVDYMAHGGNYVLVGLSRGELTFMHPKIHAKETTLMCSRNATLDDFKYVVETLSAGLFPVKSYITHRVHYKKMIEVFDSWMRPETGVIKGIVDFE